MASDPPQNSSNSGFRRLSFSSLRRLVKSPISAINGAFHSRAQRNPSDKLILTGRPITGRGCSNCFDPATLDEWKPVSDGDPRLIDVLAMPSTTADDGAWAADVRYCAGLKIGQHKYANVDDAVLSNAKIESGIWKDIIAELDGDEQTLQMLQGAKHQNKEIQATVTKECRRARSILQRMQARVSTWVLQITGYVMLKLLRCILRTVQIAPGQMKLLKKASEDDYPIIFLPNHRSHLDYILLSFILVQYGLRVPHVAAGENLSIPIVSWLLRCLGAFFIKRRLGKDHVYRAVLHSYVEELLKRGESVEFFIEAGRSRTGRPILPKAGLLSVVVETYLQGLMKNAYIVPVSISYEKIIEGSFSRELMGEPKVKETLWGTIKAIWQVFSTKYGSVRVDFAQPIRITEYWESVQNRGLAASDEMYHSSQTLTSILDTDRLCSSNTLSSKASLASLSSLGDGTIISEDENRRLIRAMCNHVLYDFSENGSLMCTQIVAYLLTTKYRRGGRLDDVVEDFHWLCQRLTAKGRDVGFSGDARDVVRYALELLGPALVNVEISDVDSGFGSEWSGTQSDTHLWLIKPTTTLPHVHELAYYAAPVALAFLRESIVADALLSSFMDCERAGCNNNNEPQQIKRKASDVVEASSVVDRAMLLADLLQHEFIFNRPCVGLRHSFEKTLERFSDDGLLLKRVPSSETSALSVKFCLERNQYFRDSALPSRRNSSTSLDSVNTAADEGDEASDANANAKFTKTSQSSEDTFYLASEEDEDDLFARDCEMDRRRSSASLNRRNSLYGVPTYGATDDYKTDVIRFYATGIAALLETYKYTIKAALLELSKPDKSQTWTKTASFTESNLLNILLKGAKERAEEGICSYAEFVNVDTMRNALKWLSAKGILVNSRERLRLHDAYVDSPKALLRFLEEMDDLCSVVTY